MVIWIIYVRQVSGLAKSSLRRKALLAASIAAMFGLQKHQTSTPLLSRGTMEPRLVNEHLDANWTGSIWSNSPADDANFNNSVGTITLTQANTAGSFTLALLMPTQLALLLVRH